MHSQRRIAALLGAVAIVVPRLWSEWRRVDDLRAAARLGLVHPPYVSAGVWIAAGLAAVVAIALVLSRGRRGLAIVGLLILAHATAEAASHARRMDLAAPHADVVEHIESPDGAFRPGALLLIQHGRAGELVWPFAPLVLVALALWTLRAEVSATSPSRPLFALAAALASAGFALLAISLWSQHELRDIALADELVVIGHGLAVGFSLRVGQGVFHWCSLGALVVVFGLFALGFGFVHQWKPTRSLCWAAKSNSYDRPTRERALSRARARLASPVAWLPSLILPVRTSCDAAAHELGL